jgi:LCP family protein required for cell wall assembly
VQPQHAARGWDGGPRHRRKIYRHRAVKVIGTIMVSVMLAGFTAVGERVRQLNANIEVLDAESLLTARPDTRSTTTAEAAPGDPFGGRAVNIAIIGSDSREGDNAQFTTDNPGSVLNDVNMIAHISADRTRVDIVAIPRDTQVPLPACQLPNGQISGAESKAAINSAFGKGSGFDPEQTLEGVACVMAALEANTGVYLDGFILVDFAGFAGMVDGLGGVDICVPYRIESPNTRLYIDAGLQHMDGTTALAYARTRKGTADGHAMDGSDLRRINRQQQLIGAVINQVLSSGDLSSLPKLNSFATAATQSLTTSPALGSVQALAGLAYSLRNINMDRVSLMMVPVVDAGDGVHVRLAASAGAGGYSAQDVFDALATDSPVPGTTAYKLAHPDPAATETSEASDGSDESGEASDEVYQASGVQASVETAYDPVQVTSSGATQGPSTGASADPAPDDGVVTGSNAPVTCEVGDWGDSY